MGGGFLFGLLPPGANDGKIHGDRVSGSSEFRGPAEGTLHIQTLFLVDSAGARREESAALMRPVWHADTRGAADQAPENATLRLEH